MKKGIGISIMMAVLALTQMALFGKDSRQDSAQAEPFAAAPSNLSFGDMMNQLSQNLTVWKTMDKANKVKAMDAVINLYKNRENAAILKPGDFYVQKLDEALAGNPAMVNSNLISVVKILSVMEYDFYNGKNKDELARETLGEKMAEAIKMKNQYLGSGR